MADSTAESDFLMEFRIPSYILLPGADVDAPPDVPNCPVLVFINAKSGGQLGGELYKTYRSLLNGKQVDFFYF